ncbi:MAG TPA: VOC family protein [Caulobacteraceae bacterium]|jgi:catechol 2,3-dioxygenase-like lactoylglutathione lyase family enzyme|nr:VOC family protein [Caulobacteraceae bacterium]
MIGYVTIGADDLGAATRFYDALFGAIGGERKSFEGGWAFYGPKDGEGNVGICKPFDGQPARAGNGVMIAFAAASQDAVKAAHAAALAHGGSDEGAPGYRPPDGTQFYGAYVRDPTGNKLCVFNAG